MKCVVISNNSKEHVFAQTLIALGHKTVGPDEADVVFAHTDDIVHNQGRDRDLIRKFVNNGKLAYLYPHAASPSIEHDGLVEPAPVTGKLVTAPGHREVLQRYGYPWPVYEIGWFYCEQLPFTPPAEVKKVLYAPMHPWADGTTMLTRNTLANRRVMQQLIRLDVDLTVRFFGIPDAAGLSALVHTGKARVTWKQIPDLRLDTADIDEADLVVSTGTFAYMAVARGKPTVFYNQNAPAWSDDGEKMVEHWDAYGDYIAYPYDLDNWPLETTIERACAGGKRLEDWKDEFIGDPMTPESLGSLLGEVAVA